MHNKIIEYEHWNSLLSFENSVMSETLQGLLETFEGISKTNSADFKIFSEFSLVIDSSKKILNECLSRDKSLLDNEREKNEILSLAEKFLNQKLDFEDLKVKMIKNYKESISKMKSELNSALIEKEKYYSECVDLEKHLQNTKNELKVIQKKYLKSQRANLNKEMEKVCVNCKSMYRESENFNWSCKTHSSKYSGQVYWCCGKTRKDAEGCESKKHTTAEQVEEEKEKKGKSCRRKGHFYNECPKDPNVKTGFEIEDERERLQRYRKNRNAKSTIMNKADLDSVMASQNRFIKSESSSKSLSFNNFEGADAIFGDIAGIKRDLGYIADY